ncbi:Stage II sporulation E family protein [Planctopirus limnophila DSM 3776]|uniref:Stage II sporulation E family protein n=1 Tax=Planctopirus limnophila (strain ATCC 43296 / DSM 3776 / IFAM 1008 / Mu 290) TaxID=521674 RepID=D5SRX3_PLAL2|nr:GAF domain-containing SpoIIE family protein phosphatase [Planctopirus limnophila]ADG66657.1 Stage II sporulation E family protein [Planctopirus limnophila DSM 3776]
MLSAPHLPNEEQRIQELYALELLDTPPEDRYDSIIRALRAVYKVPIAYISLVDRDRQWFKARVGLEILETPRSISFCGHAIAQQEPLVVPDLTQDSRFADNPMVLEAPHLRFYAGLRLSGPTGQPVGTLCMADTVPFEKPFDDAPLKELAHLVEQQFQMLDLISAQKKLLEVRAQLLQTQALLQNELRDAAEYIHSLLPTPLTESISTSHELVACSELGGDLFGYHWISEEELAIYLLDVSGHGVGASLLSVSALNALRRQALPGICFTDVESVLCAMNSAFPMEEHNGKFLTLWYGVFHTGRRELEYGAAGHPPALLWQRPGGPCTKLVSNQIMIGAAADFPYQAERVRVQQGARLYVYSDGAFELDSPAGESLGIQGLIQTIEKNAHRSSQRVSAIRESLQAFQGSADFVDDFSMIELCL